MADADDDATLDEDVELEDEELDPEDLDPEALDAEEEPEFDEVLDADLDEDDDDEDERPAAPPARAEGEEGGEEDEDEEELADSDDVEADLETILKERLVTPEEDEEDEDVEPDDRGDTGDRILPKRPGEFVCQSCFLVKHPSQLADPDAMLCRDCV